ncbi:MAG: ATP-binding protein [Anaerolineae bacterium]
MHAGGFGPAGIAPDILPSIFDSFFSTKSDGLGMGLFISRGLIMQHGGSIDVESAVGRGTTVSIFLPD